MIQNPIRKVLSTMQEQGVRCLLMGGQACVFYGAAEFSRDTDLALLAEPENLKRLHQALDELEADVIAVPPFDADYLLRGHAVHFRCQHAEALRMRIDVMSVMRGLDDFPELWERRSVVEVEPGEQYDLMGLADLVRAKKTQRDKDWPMIRRLIEANYQERREHPDASDLELWFMESRTPALLEELAERFPSVLEGLRARRRLLTILTTSGLEDMEAELAAEELRERATDRAYWEPLRRELEALRHR